jgi:ABC-2 type transport system permease protein
MNRFAILLKRESWEHRGGFLWAPIWTSGILFSLVLIILAVAGWHTARVFDGEGGFGGFLNRMLTKELPAEMDKLTLIYDGFFAGFWLIMQVVLFFVLFFYLLGALYDDRRDRSILFWKSLPVSDLHTVLSKVAMAAIGAPLVAWAATVVLHLAFIAAVSVFAMANGLSAAEYVWGPAEPLSFALRLLVTLPISALWALPAIGWLLLVSSFARSKPFLWAVAVPVAIGVAINTFDLLQAVAIPDSWYWQHIVVRMLLGVVPPSWLAATFFQEGRTMDTEGKDAVELLDWSIFADALASPETWIGAVIGVAMIAGAVYFRRKRELAD